MDTFETENEFGKGVVKSWASILDDNTRAQAEAISRCAVVDGHVALMPDAHFGYGPPVGAVIRTRSAIIPYAVGVDIGCGMIAMRTDLERDELRGLEGKILGGIRESIPSGVGTNHPRVTGDAERFFDDWGPPPGLDNIHVMCAAMQKRHATEGQVRDELLRKARLQFGTLGSGNHFIEVCLSARDEVWFVLHSGSRGIGNVLGTAHHALARSACERGLIELEVPEFAYFLEGSPSFNDYVADMLWSQRYALDQRDAMMRALLGVVNKAVKRSVRVDVPFNCHHNYAEEVEPSVWLTRKGAISAEDGRMGVIPGSMGAATHVVRGRGCAEAYNTAPHGAGRRMSRGQARRELDVGSFKDDMSGTTWLDRDAGKLIDESPRAYKSIDVVLHDSRDLVESVESLLQFINFKGL